MFVSLMARTPRFLHVLNDSFGQGPIAGMHHRNRIVLDRRCRPARRRLWLSVVFHHSPQPMQLLLLDLAEAQLLEESMGRSPRGWGK